jgi:hypothetical protein
MEEARSIQDLDNTPNITLLAILERTCIVYKVSFCSARVNTGRMLFHMQLICIASIIKTSRHNQILLHVVTTKENIITMLIIHLI